MTSDQFAKRLRKMRLAIGLTQTELARKIHVSPQTINAYEVGRRRVFAVRLFQIVKTCGWTMAQFFEPFETASIDPMIDRPPTDAELDRRAMLMESWKADV